MQSSSQIITTNKPTAMFLQARRPSCRPTNSVKALKREQVADITEKNTDKHFHSQYMIMTIITMTYWSDGVRRIKDSFLLMSSASCR